jgi:hypothetical protein
MPLLAKYEHILASFKKQYGSDEGERRFYAWASKRDLKLD